VSNESSHQFTPPVLDEGSGQALDLESILQDLPLHKFQIDSACLGLELAQIFEQNPLLPGAVLVEQGQFLGMISRRRLLEYLIRPHGIEFFLKEPLRVLYSYARSEALSLLGSTPIIVAAQQALRRSPEFLSEPILVQVTPEAYYLLDVHALNIAYWQIRGIETQVRYERAQAQMIQSDKMASLGRLVDGVAHEILDPVSFIWGNLSHVKAYSDNLLELLAAYEKHLPTLPHEIIRLKTDLEVDYLRQDFPQTIDSIRSGADRLAKLATSLQNFCHIDEVYPKPANLHELLDSILLLLKSRLTSEIQINKHYDHLPPVLCYAGQLNQVFMNILSNAVNALINQAVSQNLELDLGNRQPAIKPTVPFSKPTIEITTQIRTLSATSGEVSRWVSICIADNGPGLSPEAQKQILESFSVKKRAAKETSLALSYQIITAKHGGKLEVRSRCAAVKESSSQSDGKTNTPFTATETCSTGTEFEILLPLT
jgi:signal transduction histidine kinase